MAVTHDLAFGLWNKGGDVPYTQVFKVAAGRGKPNSNDASQAQVSPARAQPVQVASKGDNEQRQTGRERNGHRQVLTNSPVRHDPNSLKTTQNMSSLPNRSRESSPLSPSIPAKAVNNGSPGTPSRQNPNRTPGRSKLGFDSPPEKGVVIPKIGDWDPNDPAGDDITGKFKRIKSERDELSKKVPSMETEPHRRCDERGNGSMIFCCFPWFRKGRKKHIS